MSNPCLSLEVLDLFATDRGAQLPQERAHLDECERCRALLASARRDVVLFDELKEAAVNSTNECDGNSGAVSLDGYRLIRELHRGGQGVVYLAEREGSGERLAIKLQAMGRGPAQRGRFEREIDAVLALRHPNIVGIADTGWFGSQRWFAMPFVDGRELDAWVREEDPDQSSRLTLFLRICRAVGHAHRHGIIHRDIKPANILVDRAGEPQLLDFGIAKILGPEEHRLTRDGQFAGTPAYASPEQLDPSRGKATTATDVYSLGVVLFELLTGALPVSIDGDLAAVTARVLRDEPRPLGRFPWALRAIVGRALEKNAAARYASADALADDVERHLHGEPVLHGDSPRWYLLRKAMRRHRRSIAALLIVTLAALGLLLALVYHQLEQRHLRRTADQVQGVLRDILRAAGPARMGGGATLLQILEESSRRIDGALRESPDALAAVQFTIGETYLDLMMFDDAERHLAIAERRYREVADESRALLARTLFLHGVAGVHRHDREALPRLREALALRTRIVGGATEREDVELLQILRAIAMGQSRHPDTDAEDGTARVALEGLVPRFERACGAEHPEVAQTVHLLGDWHSRHGDRTEGERLFRRALAIFAATPESSPLAVACGSDFAAFLLRSQEQAHIDEAGELLEQTSALAARLFGEAQTTRMLRQLARYHCMRADYPVAERFARDAVVHELRFFAGRRPDERAKLLALVARIDVDQVDDTARAAMLEGFRHFREFRGRGAYEVSSWLNGFAHLQNALHQPKFAESLVFASLEFHCRVYGQDCPKRFEALRMLANSMIEREDYAGALLHLREAQAILARAAQLEHPVASEVASALARCRARLGESR